MSTGGTSKCRCGPVVQPSHALVADDLPLLHHVADPHLQRVYLIVHMRVERGDVGVVLDDDAVAVAAVVVARHG